jgi:acyl-CoA dehydrogenase
VRAAFEEAADRLFTDLITTETRTSAEDGLWPATLWSSCEESGFTLALVPEQLGGVGATLSDVFPLITAIGRYAVPIPLGETMIANYFLGLLGCQPVNGPAAFATESMSLRQGKVTGALENIPWGRFARHVLALAPTGSSAHLIVLATSSGEILRRRLNIAREPRDVIVFNQATPLFTLELPKNFNAQAPILAGALARAAQMAGALDSICNLSILHANERSQFGNPIGRFQAIQQMLAQMAAEAALARVSADEAFHRADFFAGSLSIPTAKIVAGEAAGVGARHAHSIHGAIGFTYEHALHSYTRRLWAWRSEYGSTSFWSKMLGASAAARGATAVWPAVTSGRWTPMEL